MSTQPPAGREPHEQPYDPELGFLFVLEREIHRGAVHAARERARAQARSDRAATAHAGRARPPAQVALGRSQERTLSPFGTRVVRRSLTLVTLLCLIGASAYGARHAFSSDPASPANVRQGAFVPVAAGDIASERWSLRLYTRGSELCRVLVAGEIESSRCSAPPHAQGLSVTSVVSPSRRYVYGVGGPAVTRVAVHAGEAFTRVPTHAVPARAARPGVLPPGTRWFVATLSRPVGEPDPPALVQALDAAGRPLGRALTDCTEAPETLPCPR